MMRIDFDSSSKLSDIHFKYERLTSLVSCLQSTVSEAAEVRGLPENALEYSLYEIEMELNKNNEELHALLKEAEYIKEATS